MLYLSNLHQTQTQAVTQRGLSRALFRDMLLNCFPFSVRAFSHYSHGRSSMIEFWIHIYQGAPNLNTHWHVSTNETVTLSSCLDFYKVAINQKQILIILAWYLPTCHFYCYFIFFLRFPDNICFKLDTHWLQLEMRGFFPPDSLGHKMPFSFFSRGETFRPLLVCVWYHPHKEVFSFYSIHRKLRLEWFVILQGLF